MGPHSCTNELVMRVSLVSPLLMPQFTLSILLIKIINPINFINHTLTLSLLIF